MPALESLPLRWEAFFDFARWGANFGLSLNTRDVGDKTLARHSLPLVLPNIGSQQSL
jgi:hypothetical protein